MKHCTASYATILITILLIADFCSFAPSSSGATSRKDNEEEEDDNDVDKPTSEGVQGFLSRFGYLPESNMEMGNLRTDEEIREAVIKFQRYANIPETGRLDNATLTVMATPRCGNKDPVDNTARKRRYVHQGARWKKHNLRFRIDNYALGLYPAEVEYELNRAIRLWEESSSLSFTRVARGQDADIVVQFVRGHHGDGYAFDGESGVLAHAFFPGRGRGGDAHFDLDEPWVIRDDGRSNTIKLFVVAAHEFGHSLGLEHSFDPEALMYPYYQGVLNTLPYDDKIGITALYGFKNTHRQYPPPTTKATATATQLTSVTTTTVAATTQQEQNPYVTSVVEILPNKCQTSYDAIAFIHREIFIFKSKYFWRLSEPGIVYEGCPEKIRNFWPDLPENLESVDAVYQRPDGKIVFFTGRYYWVFEANRLQPGYPKHITSLGLPARLRKIDAAMVWNHNQKTYLYSGAIYWRYDDLDGRVEPDYPRDMAVWKNVPEYLDAAFTYNGKTYFFKGFYFWEFDNGLMAAQDPQNSAENWMGCSPSEWLFPTEEVDYDSANSLRVSLLSVLCLTLYHTL